MKTQFLARPNGKFATALALLALTPVLAQAHPMPGEVHSFMGGLTHPLRGLDHILAMVAVGLWAAQLGGRALWLVPAAFVSLMTLGGALGMTGLPLPLFTSNASVETGIMLSILVFGLLIVTAVRLPVFAGMALVGLFALFHGHSHGTELPAAASGLTYAVGFIVATAFLHACGVALGLIAQKKLPAPALRIAGAAIVAAGICLWVS